MRALALLALLAAPLAAQAQAQVTPDTVVVYVVGRPRAANVLCPTFGYVGDTISCRIWATDSAGQRTVATFGVTSSAPGIVEPVGIVNDTILRLRLVSRGVSTIVVNATAPSAVIIGGLLNRQNGEYTRASAITGINVTWDMTEVNMRLCGYVLSQTDTIGKSWSDCPGGFAVMPFRWEWTLHQPTPMQQASATVHWRRR